MSQRTSQQPSTRPRTFTEEFERAFAFPPRDFQVEVFQNYADHKDTLLVVPTGAGKSVCWQSLALWERPNGKCKILLIEPGKALADNQVCIQKSITLSETDIIEPKVLEAERRGIRAIAVHEDTIAEATQSNPPRDLFKEAIKGDAEIIVLTPEMLETPRFDSVLTAPRFVAALKAVVVDEMHLLYEWGETWRPSYLQIGRLRARLPSNVWWLGASASCPDNGPLARIRLSLGFQPDSHALVRRPVDRLDISYQVRILEHATSGTTFHDIDWLFGNPNILKPEDIPKTIIYCKTIKLCSLVAKYLHTLVPGAIADPTKVIMTFHSIRTQRNRSRIVEDFERGTELRILVATDCACVGINVKGIEVIIVLSLCMTLNALLQWLGRVAR